MLTTLCRIAADLTALLVKAAAPRAKLMYPDAEVTLSTNRYLQHVQMVHQRQNMSPMLAFSRLFWVISATEVGCMAMR